MRVLADNGRFVVADDAGRLVFLERRGLVPTWTVFVLGLLVGVFALASVGIAAAVNFEGRWVAAAVLVGLAAVLAGALRWVMGKRRRRLAVALRMEEASVVVDAAGGVLSDRTGRVIAPLREVKFKRVMQATSSSRALAVAWSGGTRVVFRGDPFAGAIDGAVDVLRGRGIAVE